MRMKRFLTEGAILVCLFLMIFLSLRGKSLSDVTPEEVRQALSREFDGMEEASDLMLRTMYGFDREAVDGAVCFASQDFMDVREVLILKAADDNVPAEAEALVLRRIEEEKAVFESYAPEAFSLLSKAQVWRRGPWLVVVIRENAEDLVLKIRGMIER